jgi:ferredoxin/flavodoxin---NADP+ reductase
VFCLNFARVSADGSRDRCRGRITGLITTRMPFADIGLGRIDSRHDRVMLRGSPDMLAQMTILLGANDFEEGSRSAPGCYVVETAIAEK